MKRYTGISTIYEGTESSFFFIEGTDDCELNSFIRGYREYIILSLRNKGVDIAGFNIVSPATLDIDSIKRLILRQQPTLDRATLENLAEESLCGRQRSRSSRLIFVNGTGYNIDGCFGADIICEDDFGRSMPEHTTRLDKFLETIATLRSHEARIAATKYRFVPVDEDDGGFRSIDHKECLCNDLLAESICDCEECEISPIIFDNDFNISLPLYPHVAITLEPLPKTLYILFLQHPEGIVLKDMCMYESELKRIYSHVSGRKNPTVINRMFRSLIDTNELPLHKNLSIIRRCFTSKLNYNIARNYIPSHGRRKAHVVPLESEFVILPDIV